MGQFPPRASAAAERDVESAVLVLPSSSTPLSLAACREGRGSTKPSAYVVTPRTASPARHLPRTAPPGEAARRFDQPALHRGREPSNEEADSAGGKVCAQASITRHAMARTLPGREGGLSSRKVLEQRARKAASASARASGPCVGPWLGSRRTPPLAVPFPGSPPGSVLESRILAFPTPHTSSAAVDGRTPPIHSCSLCSRRCGGSAYPVRGQGSKAG